MPEPGESRPSNGDETGSAVKPGSPTASIGPLPALEYLRGIRENALASLLTISITPPHANEPGTGSGSSPDAVTGSSVLGATEAMAISSRSWPRSIGETGPARHASGLGVLRGNDGCGAGGSASDCARCLRADEEFSKILITVLFRS